MGQTLAPASFGHDTESEITDNIDWEVVNVDTTVNGGILRAKERTIDLVFTMEPSNFALGRQELYENEEEHNKRRFFALFRHPVERAISMFSYLQMARWEPTYMPEWLNMTVIEWANLPNNGQEDYLVHKLAGKQIDEPVDESDLVIAMELVRDRFFVGLAEEMNESIRRFNIVLGVLMSDRSKGCMEEFGLLNHLPNKDVTSAADVSNKPPPWLGFVDTNDPKFDEDSPEYKAVASKNNLDIRLYDYIETLFDSQQEIINSSEATSRGMQQQPPPLGQQQQQPSQQGAASEYRTTVEPEASLQGLQQQPPPLEQQQPMQQQQQQPSQQGAASEYHTTIEPEATLHGLQYHLPPLGQQQQQHQQQPSQQGAATSQGLQQQTPPLGQQQPMQQQQQQQQQSSENHRDIVVAQGAGPELIGLAGQDYKFDGEARWVQQGATWYNVLTSPMFQWNMVPYRWDSCPDKENMFVGNTGFTFHEPHPKDPTKMKSWHLQFRLNRGASRECLFNGSGACLGGGSFIMTFAQQGKDMLYPGDYSLKTSGGMIRIVAYNINRDCIRKRYDSSESGEQTDRSNTDAATALDGNSPSSSVLPEKRPIDYLHQAKSITMNPEGCDAWIKERELRDDLFSYDSDLSTVHIDTPWMKIVIEAQQNKVAEEDSCVFAGMNTWITDVNPALKGELSGALSYQESEAHEVDGPFGMEHVAETDRV
ncbi:hypothetical protein ACHAXR_012152 [Thalassiosira sp. AJA248-18]